MYFMLAAFCLLSAKGFSQSLWEKSSIGIGIGGIKYSGDIPNEFTKLAFQGFYSYKLTDHISLRGQFAIGTVGARDNGNINSPMGRPHPFESRIQEASILGEYNFLNLQEYKWTPYVLAGIGFFHFQPFFTQYDPTTNRNQDYGYSVSSNKKWSFPIGLGFKYAITDKIGLFVEGSFRYTNTDEIDGYQPTDFPIYKKAKVNDFFGTGTAGITFNLGGNANNDGGGKRSSKYNSNRCPPVYQ